MNKYIYIILILITAVFLGYAKDIMPIGEIGFPYGDVTAIDSRWYWYIVFKDIRSVLLVWALWVYAIPRREKVIKLGASVFCVLITLVPINFVLFYSAPFHGLWFVLKLAIAVAIGYAVTHFNGRDLDNSDNSGIV